MNRPRASARATAKVVVLDTTARSYDEFEGGTLSVVEIDERFDGTLSGTSTVRALEWKRSDGSAVVMSLQRVTGMLGGRHGSYVLQGKETVENGRISATWQVLPGSATGELENLRGEGGFEGKFGEGSDAVLDYWFD